MSCATRWPTRTNGFHPPPTALWWSIILTSFSPAWNETDDKMLRELTQSRKKNEHRSKCTTIRWSQKAKKKLLYSLYCESTSLLHCRHFTHELKYRAQEMEAAACTSRSDFSFTFTSRAPSVSSSQTGECSIAVGIKAGTWRAPDGPAAAPSEGLTIWRRILAVNRELSRFPFHCSIYN